MRLACVLLLALAACGQSTTVLTTSATTTAASPPAIASTVSADAPPLTGYVLGYGDGWKLDIGRDIGHILITRTEDGASWGGDYAPPVQTGPGKYRFASDSIEVNLEVAPCTHDGVVYPMRATVLARAHEDTTGCAVERWDHALLALMPQIDACIAQAPSSRMVTYAGPQDGATLVRLRGEGGAFDCRVAIAGVVVKTNRSESLRVASEDRAIFMRGPGENPGGECYQAPEVYGPNGALLGWMIDPEGC